MDSILATNPNGKKLLLGSLLLLQFAWIATTLFGLPVINEILGFLYLTFVPGYVIINLSNLKKISSVEAVFLSVGFSVAFLMLGGLCLDYFAAVFSVPQPLSFMPLFLLVTVPIFIGIVILLLKRTGDEDSSWSPSLDFSLSSLIFTVFPVLAVAGAVYVNVFADNNILLATVVLIAAVFLATLFSKKAVPSKNYVVLILMVSITLLLHYSLISNYIVGNDIHLEFYLAQFTRQNGFWDSTAFTTNLTYGRYNAMLSITILPTVYSVLLNLTETWVFKIIFPLIFAFVPIVFYQTLQKKVDKKVALVSVFLLVSQSTFYTEMLGLARQMIAELFFVLLFFVLFNTKLTNRTKVVCWLVFSVGLIVSHYSLALVFLFFICASWAFGMFFKKQSGTLNLNLILMFLVLMFSWYIFSSGAAPFQSIQVFGESIIQNLGDFFNPASRGSSVLRGLGLESSTSIWQTLSRAFAYGTEVLIVIGFLGLLVKWKKNDVNWDFFAVSLSGMILLAMVIVVPKFASTLNMTRFYHIILFAVAPLFALGAQTIAKYAVRRKKELFSVGVIAVVLIPYFLFQVGFVYEVTGSQSWSVPLSNYRMDKMTLYQSTGFFVKQDVYGASWFSQNVDYTQHTLYCDLVSRYTVLTSYSTIYAGDFITLANWTRIEPNGVVYLSSLNVVHGHISSEVYVWNYTEISPKFDVMNKVYSNGGSEIYFTVDT